LDPPCRLVAVDPGELDVHENEIGHGCLRPGHRLFAGRGLQDRAPHAAQQIAQDAAGFRVIVDDEDTPAHKVSLGKTGACCRTWTGMENPNAAPSPGSAPTHSTPTGDATH